MKYIRLEYDKKLCKEKLEKNKKSARQRFLQKICIVICGTGVYFLLLSAILHIPQELRIRSRGTERHSASD